MPTVALLRPRTPFEASFAQAQDQYFRAQVIAKRQLDALEEWDPDGIRGSLPEHYRRRLIARTGEIGQAELAAREAARRATTDEEVYRATRLLTHVEGDLGHSRMELELARKLVALQPRSPWALLLLARAAEHNGQESLARQAAARAGRLIQLSRGYPRGPRSPS